MTRTLPADVDTDLSDERYISAAELFGRKGLLPICHMTVIRWMETEGFPRPTQFKAGGRRFWRLGDVRRWLRGRESQGQTKRETPVTKRLAAAEAATPTL